MILVFVWWPLSGHNAALPKMKILKSVGASDLILN